MNTIRSINNRVHDLQLTIEKPLLVDNFQKPAEANSSVASERRFEKANSKVVYFLNSEQRSTIAKKNKWMQKQTGELHSLIQKKYPDAEVLIKEVGFYIMNRNMVKTHDFTRALRSAAKMIRNDTWSISKRFVHMQVEQREENAYKLK